MAPASRVSAKVTVWASAGSSLDGAQPELAGVLGKCLLRPLRPEEAAGQADQLLDLGAATPEAAADGPVPLQGVHKQGCLGRLRGVGCAQQGDGEEGTEIGGQAPEQAVGDLIQSLEAEQGLRLEPAIPNSPSSTKDIGSQPDLANEGSSRV